MKQNKHVLKAKTQKQNPQHPSICTVNDVRPSSMQTAVNWWGIGGEVVGQSVLEGKDVSTEG
jgi:hypothetical protein